jgi:hypothetical protein
MPKFGKLYRKPYVVCVKIVLSCVLCVSDKPATGLQLCLKSFCSNLTGKHSHMGILMLATGRPNLIGKMLAAS